MVFTPPTWLPPLPEIPDSITVGEFLNDEKYGRRPISTCRDPYTCGITGRSYSTTEFMQRTEYLARGLGSRLGFDAAEGTPWHRVVCLYSANTIDYMTAAHAVHQLDGIVTPASAAYSASELEYQLRSSGATALITCLPLLETALAAAKAVGITEDRIVLLSLPKTKNTSQFRTADDLIEEGRSLPPLAPLAWKQGQGKRQTAFLCYSSGTSGLPKAVMVSHYNIISNLLQLATVASVDRKENEDPPPSVALGVLPLSHIYGLVGIGLASNYFGAQIIVLPKFDFEAILYAIQEYRIERMSIVPPILVRMIEDIETTSKYDLSSVVKVGCAAAPLGQETTDQMHKLYPNWHISQAYGLTEASPAVSGNSENEIVEGSSGFLVPGSRAKLIDRQGEEITTHECPGELLVQSPSITLGYLHNEKANAETYIWDNDGRWLKTGDEVLMRRSESGADHVVVVDRIKELIKVKGHQVAPAELEAHLLLQDFVADCAVVAIPDLRSGELPKAYVVKSEKAKGLSEEKVTAAILKHVEEHKAKHKWLKGGVRFIDTIPKSPTGKILRRVLRDKQAAEAKAAKAKL